MEKYFLCPHSFIFLLDCYLCYKKALASMRYQYLSCGSKHSSRLYFIPLLGLTFHDGSNIPESQFLKLLLLFRRLLSNLIYRHVAMSNHETKKKLSNHNIYSLIHSTCAIFSPLDIQANPSWIATTKKAKKIKISSIK